MSGVWSHSGVWSLDHYGVWSLESGITPGSGVWSLESFRSLEAGVTPENLEAGVWSTPETGVRSHSPESGV